MDGPHLFRGTFILMLPTVRDYEWGEGDPLMVMMMGWPRSSKDGSESICESILEGKFIVHNDSQKIGRCVVVWSREYFFCLLVRQR